MHSPQSNMNPGMDLTPLQMSASALPNVAPAPQSPSGPGPQVVAPPEFPKQKSKGWIWGLVLVVAAGAGYWGWQKRQQSLSQANVVALRTAPAESGVLTRTLRLTGVTAAEKYVSLIAPSLRGGRGNSSSGSMGASQGGSNRTGGGSTAVSSNSGGNSSSSSSSSASVSSVASAGTALASTSGSATGSGSSNSAFAGGGDSVASSAGNTTPGAGLRSARSAASGGAATSTRPASTRTSAPSASATLGSDGLGSTSNQIPGGGGNTGGGGGGRGMSAGGGGGDFMMQLQSLAPNGSRVSKGDPVAEFDRQYMLLRLDDQKANVDQSEMQMKASLATLEVTRKSYNQQILAAKNLVEKSELDLRTIPVRSAIDAERLRLASEEAKANLKQLQEAAKYVDIGERATLKVADLELAASKLELRRAQANADRMMMKAPINGLVVVQNTFRSGDFGPIQQGDQVYPGMMFMQVVDASSMIINANVNQADVQNLKLGQRATVRVDAFPGLELPAHVVTIGAITKSAGMRASFKKDVAVRLRLDKIDPRIIPDLSVSADVVLEEADAPALVPAEAIMSDASAGGAESKPFVMVRNAAGVWERRDVQISLLSNTHAAIRTGVKPGEVVALEPPTTPGKTEAASS